VLTMLELVLLATLTGAPGQAGGAWQIANAEVGVASTLEGGLFTAKALEGSFVIIWARVSPTSPGGQSIAASEIEILGYSAGGGRTITSKLAAVAVGVGTRTEAIGGSRSTCGYLVFDGFHQGGATLADNDPSVGSFRFDRTDPSAPVMLKLKEPASLCLAFAVPGIAAKPDRVALRFGTSKVEVPAPPKKQ
jgi:hypothetical protein